MERIAQGDHRVSYAVSIAAILCGCGSEPEKRAPLRTVAEKVGQTLAGEIEPNPDAARATPIGNDAVVRANIYPSGDVDYYRFTGQAGERVYAATMTNFSPLGSRDTVLSILGSDGTTVLEEDNDNGTLGLLSSTIAGTSLPATGTYYVRVEPRNPFVQIRPYDLHFLVRSGTPIAEAEPNNGFTTAQRLDSGLVSGSVSAAGENDLYAVDMNAGETLFASLDLDPERDGTSLDGFFGIGRFSGGFLAVDNNGNEGGPDSESDFVTVSRAETYFVVVSGRSTGTYQLATSVRPSAPSCETYTISPDPALTIPAGPGLTTVTLEVPDDIIIGDLNVNLLLTHDSIADLDVHLVAPGGNDVGLFSDISTVTTSGNTLTALDLTLDDEGAIPPGPFASSIAGTVMQPEADYRLHWFDGQNARGTWTLKIWDDSAPHGGSLASFGLSICAMPSRPACPSGTTAATLYSTDFEADAGNFTHSGNTNQWARGLPSVASAPITSCASGVNCFKTNLNGRYAARSSSDLVSPSIDLTGAVAPITVEWAQAYQLESAQSDHASVDVREVGGGRPTRIFEFLDPTMQDSVGNPSSDVQESAGWGIRRQDISAYAGASVELLFHQDADAALEFSGFAIDDVSVVGCIPSCGNGDLDEGEACDDGNRQDGDCCSAACQFEELGTSCADADRCDGAETCNGAGECVAGSAVVCVPSDECHVAGTCSPSSGCSNPSAPNGTPCSNGTCQAGRCIADGIGGAGGESGAGGDSGAGGEITAGQGGSAGTAGTSSAGEGGEGATSGNGGTSAGGSNGGTSVGGNNGGTSTGGNNGGTSTGGDDGGAGEDGEAGDGTSGSSRKSSADESSGCGCHVVGRGARGFEGFAFGVLLLVLARRARRTTRLFEQTV